MIPDNLHIFNTIFHILRDWDCAIVGSILRDYRNARDIDVLFRASQDFRQLARELGIPYRGGFDTPQGRIHSLHYNIPGVARTMNLFQVAGVEHFEEWSNMVRLRDGRVLNAGKHWVKSGNGIDLAF